MFQHILNEITTAGLIWSSWVFVAFFVALFVGSKWLPGKIQEGALLPDGTRQTYNLNGLLLMIAVIAFVLVGTFGWGLSLSKLYLHFWSLFVVINVFALLWTIVLYIQGPDKEKGLIKDLWYGAELNPTWWGVDLKMFAYRPSLIGLAVLNASFAYVQLEKYGSISSAMWCYQGLTLFYLLGTFQYEHGMLSMFDIIEEKFGFMLVWGDLVLVPFFYCIPGFFLINPAHSPPVWAQGLLCALCLLGFFMFRGANSQKNQFKRDPQQPIWGRTPEAIDGRLLVSGWWGLGRKINYTGEILMYLSWTMLTGFHSFWPYLLPLWLISLLVHRAWRDDKRCRAKYGELWERYCQRVKFRMVPFIY